MATGIQRRRQQRQNPLGNQSPLQDEQTMRRDHLGGLAGTEGGRFATDRRNLAGVMGQFGDLAAGQGPSLAQDMHHAATQRNIAATIAAMGSARGGNLAANSTAAATAGAGLGQAASMDAAQLRSQEQLNAMQAQAGIAGQLAGLSSQRELGLLGMGNDMLMGQAGLMQQQQLANAQLAEQIMARRRQNLLQGLQLGAQVGGDVLGGVLSDERMKTDIDPVEPGSLAARLAQYADDGEGSEVLGEVEPFEFAYTDEGKRRGGLPGRIPGVMAQHLRRAGGPVDEDADGTLRIPGPGGLSLALAAGADHERRLRALEGR